MISHLYVVRLKFFNITIKFLKKRFQFLSFFFCPLCRLFFLSLIGVIFPLKFIKQFTSHTPINPKTIISFDGLFIMFHFLWYFSNVNSNFCKGTSARHSLFVNFPCLVFGCSLGMIQYLPKTKLPLQVFFHCCPYIYKYFVCVHMVRAVPL